MSHPASFIEHLVAPWPLGRVLAVSAGRVVSRVRRGVAALMAGSRGPSVPAVSTAWLREHAIASAKHRSDSAAST